MRFTKFFLTASLAFGLASPALAADDTPELRLHYTFDESSGQTARDAAPSPRGGDHDGTLVNASFDDNAVPGKFGNALDLSQNDPEDYVVIGSGGPGSLVAEDGSFSVAFWAHDAFWPGRSDIWAAANLDGAAFSVVTLVDREDGFINDRVQIGADPALGESANFNFTFPILDRAKGRDPGRNASGAMVGWHHIAFTVNPADGITAVYLNGEPMADTRQASFGVGDEGTGSIGTRLNGGEPHQLSVDADDAAIDDFAIFAGELSREQVEKIRDEGVAALGPAR